MNLLTEAIENDSIAQLKSLIEEGVDLNKSILIGEEYDLEDYDNISPLFYAIRKYASLAFIEIMLENGVDLYATDSDGVSALDIAVKFKRKDVIRYCIDQGFNLNTTKRKSGITPVILAACFSDIEMMQILLDGGGDINATDRAGMSPLDYSRKLGQKQMKKYLEEHGARYAAYCD
ncbi:MAG: ankyrin repeat domain-containing protein [Sulfurovum sp.]|nr:ankyrin repeat domain-containing protein [Sulfurovum sp.]MCB4750122.1 ankyrin repeat domain-containing protein [Sulfurovum sp.]MCB4751889.1 ankyrin repeat domain-containing protein [Sulfurovum sp.]MCB4752630.1 ankyrin repeat domain-containing protein [Sulfurovum sp.]MCB4754009.1 ankyrin repeat domain-containing protein [Sulfurovum sp.]